MESKLKTQIEWIIIENEDYKIINDNEVHYLLKNGFLIKVTLNLYTYDRNVSVYTNTNRQIAFYDDLSKERIIEKMRMYEKF